MNFAPFHGRRASIRLTGAVYTPSDVAGAIVRLVRASLPSRPLRILEPSVGDGAILGQLASCLPGQEYIAVDIDRDVIGQLKDGSSNWPARMGIHACDFIKFACDELEAGAHAFDLIIGNPPFIRKHNFSLDHRKELLRLARITGSPPEGLKNSWAGFLLASSRLVSDDGIVAFVLPYELITVAYGHAALRDMRCVFPRIDLFVSDEKAFPDIDQDAILFVGRRRPTGPHGVFVQRVQRLSDLAGAVEHDLALTEDATSLDLNGFLIDSGLMPALRRFRSESLKFSDVGRSSPGVVTAANDFFILRQSEVIDRGLEDHVLPILKKGSLTARSPVLSMKDFEDLAGRAPTRLLHVRGRFEELDSSLQSYLRTGMERGIPERYKCRNRRNWYEVRLVERAPGFFLKRTHAFPRLCINEADVYLTDTAYGIRPREGYSMRGICFSFYNSLTMLFAETDGRFYGGGVLELTPNELKNLPLVYHEPSDRDFDAFLEVHRKAGSDPGPILDFGDAWLQQHLQSDEIDLVRVRRAWLSVRSHRLRHSSRAGNFGPQERLEPAAITSER